MLSPAASPQLMASPAASPQLMASLLITPKRHPLDKHTTQAFDEVFGEEHQEVLPSTRDPELQVLLSTRRISELQPLAKSPLNTPDFRPPTARQVLLSTRRFPSSNHSPSSPLNTPDSRVSSLKPGNAARRPSVNTMDVWTHRWTLEDWKMDNLLSFSSPMMDTSS